MEDRTIPTPGNEMGLTLEQLIAALGPLQKVGAGLAQGMADWAKYPGQVLTGTTPQGANPYDWSAGTALGMVGMGKPGVTGNSFGSGLSLAEIGKKAFHEKLGPESPHFNPDKPGVPEPLAVTKTPDNLPVVEEGTPSPFVKFAEALHAPAKPGATKNYVKFAEALLQIKTSVAVEAFDSLSTKAKGGVVAAMAKTSPEEFALFTDAYNAYKKTSAPNPFEQAASGNMDALVSAQEKYNPVTDIALDPNVSLDHYQRAKAAKKNLPEAPVDEATRQQRRIDAGFTTPAYHGSKAWGAEHPERVVKGEEFYAAPPELADMYAGVYPGNTPEGWGEMFYNRSSVQPLYLNTQDFHVHDAGGKNWSDTGANNRGIADARNKGAPGVTIKNVYDEPASTQYLGAPKDIHIAFDPTKIRSAFAQFDPAKLHLNDLLAGLGAGVGGGLLADQVFKQKLLNGDAL